MNASRRTAFTLIELLVVIGVIGLLVAILLPTLGMVRTQGQQVVCANQLRQLGTACTAAAATNHGEYPSSTQHSGTWLWDISRVTTDKLIAHGAVRKAFYCPFVEQRQNTDGHWNFDPNYRVTGYFWFVKRPVSALPALTAPKTYKAGLRDAPKNGEDAELASDATLSQGGSFISVKGGFVDTHVTSHTRGDRPLGGFILFMDGHVSWRRFDEMKVRTGSANPEQWF